MPKAKPSKRTSGRPHILSRETSPTLATPRAGDRPSTKTQAVAELEARTNDPQPTEAPAEPANDAMATTPTTTEAQPDTGVANAADQTPPAVPQPEDMTSTDQHYASASATRPPPRVVITPPTREASQ
ncbi:hypothetical protein BGZ73_002454, partial [Actinomortierella ambigua]